MFNRNCLEFLGIYLFKFIGFPQQLSGAIAIGIRDLLAILGIHSDFSMFSKTFCSTNRAVRQLLLCKENAQNFLGIQPMCNRKCLELFRLKRPLLLEFVSIKCYQKMSRTFQAYNRNFIRISWISFTFSMAKIRGLRGFLLGFHGKNIRPLLLEFGRNSRICFRFFVAILAFYSSNRAVRQFIFKFNLYTSNLEFLY